MEFTRKSFLTKPVVAFTLLSSGQLSREGSVGKPSSASKLDAEARRKAMEGGMMPLDYLLAIMREEDQDSRFG